MITIEERKCSKIPGLSSMYVSCPYNADVISKLKALDVYNYNKTSKEWEIPVTSLYAFVNSVQDIDDITLNLLKDKKPIVVDENIQLGKRKTKPLPHQDYGVRYGLSGHNKWLLLDVPGCGKTKQLIDLAYELKQRKEVSKCLIVCGINTLKENWVNEIHKHSDLSCRILGERTKKTGKKYIGGVPDRLDDLKHKLNEFFIITNIETLRNKDIVKELVNGKNSFDMVVVDEIHVVKNIKAEQTKGLLKLNSAKYCIGATGTLIMNNPLDCYAPLKWIGVEKSNYTTFKYYYCTFGGPFGNIPMGFKNLDVLKEQLETISLRRDKSTLKLPPKTIIDEYVEMDDAQKALYENIKSGIISQVDKVKITTSSILGMMTRLRQATAAPSILTSEHIPSAKIDRCVDLIEQLMTNGEKVVVFSTYKATCTELFERVKQYGAVVCTGDVDDVTISDNINKFQNNANTRIFIATHSKCGTGITLTAASYMIFIDTPYTASAFEQNQDRIHRIGTQNPVFIYNLITKDTVDERVHDIIIDKGLISEYIIDDVVSPKLAERLKQIILDLE